jgi:O-antigen/teichoic acid export membrane protein
MNLTSNILTTLLARMATLGLALISSIILARLLGPEGRGLFALVLLLPELAAAFGLLGFESANAVYAGLEPEKRRALVWHSVVVAVVMGGVLSIAGVCWLVFGGWGSQAFVHGPLWPYLLLLSIIPGRLVSEYWGAILRGMNHILLLNVVEVGTKLVSLALVLVFVAWLRLGVAGAIWANFLLSVGPVLLMANLLMYAGAWGKPAFDWTLWKRTRRFALPAYCANIVGFLHYRIDQFILAVLLPPEQLGFYVIAVDLAERLWILTGAVGNALLPHLTNSPGRDPALPAVITRHVLVWTGGACLLVFVLADVVIRVLYSAEFIGAVSPLRWLLPGVFVSVIWKVLVAEILAREKVHYTVWITLIATLMNIVGNLTLVPYMGIPGAALASSISYSLMAVIMTWCYLRETGVLWTALVPRWGDLVPYTALWREKSPLFTRGLTKRA